MVKEKIWKIMKLVFHHKKKLIIIIIKNSKMNFQTINFWKIIHR